MPNFKQKQIHQIGQFFELWISIELEIAIEKPKENDRQLSKSILLQARTSECKSAHQPHEAFRFWDPSHVFWRPFSFTDEAHLLKLCKIKISEYHLELKSTENEAGSRETVNNNCSTYCTSRSAHLMRCCSSQTGTRHNYRQMPRRSRSGTVQQSKQRRCRWSRRGLLTPAHVSKMTPCCQMSCGM